MKKSSFIYIIVFFFFCHFKVYGFFARLQTSYKQKCEKQEQSEIEIVCQGLGNRSSIERIEKLSKSVSTPVMNDVVFFTNQSTDLIKVIKDKRHDLGLWKISVEKNLDDERGKSLIDLSKSYANVEYFIQYWQFQMKKCPVLNHDTLNICKDHIQERLDELSSLQTLMEISMPILSTKTMKNYIGKLIEQKKEQNSSLQLKESREKNILENKLKTLSFRPDEEKEKDLKAQIDLKEQFIDSTQNKVLQTQEFDLGNSFKKIVASSLDEADGALEKKQVRHEKVILQTAQTTINPYKIQKDIFSDNELLSDYEAQYLANEKEMFLASYCRITRELDANAHNQMTLEVGVGVGSMFLPGAGLYLAAKVSRLVKLMGSLKKAGKVASKALEISKMSQTTKVALAGNEALFAGVDLHFSNQTLKECKDKIYHKLLFGEQGQDLYTHDQCDKELHTYLAMMGGGYFVSAATASIAALKLHRSEKEIQALLKQHKIPLVASKELSHPENVARLKKAKELLVENGLMKNSEEFTQEQKTLILQAHLVGQDMGRKIQFLEAGTKGQGDFVKGQSDYTSQEVFLKQQLISYAFPQGDAKKISHLFIRKGITGDFSDSGDDFSRLLAKDRNVLSPADPLVVSKNLDQQIDEASKEVQKWMGPQSGDLLMAWKAKKRLKELEFLKVRQQMEIEGNSFDDLLSVQATIRENTTTYVSPKEMEDFTNLFDQSSADLKVDPDDIKILKDLFSKEYVAHPSTQRFRDDGKITMHQGGVVMVYDPKNKTMQIKLIADQAKILSLKKQVSILDDQIQQLADKMVSEGKDEMATNLRLGGVGQFEGKPAELLKQKQDLLQQIDDEHFRHGALPPSDRDLLHAGIELIEDHSEKLFFNKTERELIDRTRTTLARRKFQGSTTPEDVELINEFEEKYHKVIHNIKTKKEQIESKRRREIENLHVLGHVVFKKDHMRTMTDQVLNHNESEAMAYYLNRLKGMETAPDDDVDRFMRMARGCLNKMKQNIDKMGNQGKSLIRILESENELNEIDRQLWLNGTREYYGF